MRAIAAEDFRDQWLSILDEVEAEGVLITKDGKPVARLVPIRSQSAGLIGALKGKIKIKGDIMSTGVHWDAES
ncbi:MAG TPA: type II toxin-antitoxin system prevent-host-death family antitoxin [Phycisphaerae bacterium]|jgi:prevent-host-death family protein|nr:type II toxin-antitoxin system prevent-host-death family antitoxin [Phycisphaerae bacterium]HOB74821.1 type II toxin-antitoxin system prevent-host-death family antitoxin [Phycisphaerae bacterium]HOJ54344.1 type II toxin-antitoxin system prevent-host-death family antitoxin [Phycisphaerae bacterium]HOL26815.1 type II toxin-antitoxin system prevent-host-death family antitoxin [Phycisphaerae bacterium]HPP19976.1 type II toxin-antitoxin system prevent-host-death family antitoxin [Phycisphaerae ba